MDSLQAICVRSLNLGVAESAWGRSCAMRILIIGGTVFLGRALVDAARQRGHRVTLFNRGLSNPEAYPDIETIHGDRETDLERLRGGRWDAAIDTCGYAPRQLAISTDALRGAVDHYSFISTLSVYPVAGEPNRAESASVLNWEDGACEEVTAASYGPLKVGCERKAVEAFPRNSLIIRAGLIVGPFDPTNRFTYWVTRAARGGDAIAPPAEQPLQFIDARDLGAFVLRGIETRLSGIYNVTGPAKRMTFGQFLPAVIDALGSDARVHHLSDAFLRERQIREFVGLPLWLAREAAESFMTFRIDRALAAGLTYRPLAQTVRDTFEWARALPDDAPKEVDLSSELERELLSAWQA